MAAPKGNQFWKLAKNIGSNPLYESNEKLQEAISDYFNNGVKKRKVLVGKAPNQTEIEIPVPTISGLCFYLGFESRQSFYDYEKKKDFAYTIKRARLFIEQEYEEQLQHGNTTGAIFALKNMGWKDTQVVDMEVRDRSFNLNIVKNDKNVGPTNPAAKHEFDNE